MKAKESCECTRLVDFGGCDVDLCPFGFKSEPEKAQKDCRGCVELKNDLFWAIFGLWVKK